MIESWDVCVHFVGCGVSTHRVQATPKFVVQFIACCPWMRSIPCPVSDGPIFCLVTKDREEKDTQGEALKRLLSYCKYGRNAAPRNPSRPPLVYPHPAWSLLLCRSSLLIAAFKYFNHRRQAIHSLSTVNCQRKEEAPSVRELLLIVTHGYCR